MIFLHINSTKDVGKVVKMIKQGKNIFILIYMEGCGPCNATRPEWAKIESALKDQYAKNDKLVVVDMNKDFMENIKHIGKIDGFPTMKYIGSHGKLIESYEKSSVKKKDRSVSSFINWIESKINKMESTTPTSSAKHVYNRILKRTNHNKSPDKTYYKQTRKQHTRKQQTRKQQTRKQQTRKQQTRKRKK